MTKVTIVGSGPAAAAAALALCQRARCEVEILDIGERLEADRAELLAGISALGPSDWPLDATRELSRQPSAPAKGELPQKWLFGSDFPFRDAGQLEALTVERVGNQASISGAFGGFSNAWGAQVMPFSRPTLDAWPIGYEAMLPHYAAVLRQIPFAGADDDYSDWFPLLADAEPLPPLAPPAAAVLRRYGSHRQTVRRRGVTLGQARLAMAAARCSSCGLCLTGCPSRLVYDSSHSLTPLIRDGAVRYRGGVIVVRVGEDERGCWIQLRDLAADRLETVRTDRVLLACGGLGSTRVALGSIRPDTRWLTLQESVQIVLPFLSRVAHQDPRSYSTFTLNQFNMLVEYGRAGLDLAQMHLYPYNPTFEDALPALLGRSEAVRRAVLRRVVAALGYLPSWASPSVEVSVSVIRDDGLPAMHLRQRQTPATGRALRRVLARLVAVAPAIDLWPVVSSVRLSGAAKSYHFGGSFPHVAGRPRAGAAETDSLGRPAEWKRVHMIDASVLPSIAATTFTLTVMANAHRIATAIARGQT